MRKLFLVAGLLIAFAAAPAALANDVPNLSQPRPSWLTHELKARIVAAGTKGVEVRFPTKAGARATELNCLGTAPPYARLDGVAAKAVSAGTCMVSPSGCSMNFVFTDGASNYIGTAGHCAGAGKTVIAQIATRVDPTNRVVTLAAIGTVAKSMNQEIGKDFALVRINAGFRVVPGVSGALGPTGVYCGNPVGQPVMHYGHGYVFFVEQGHPKFGEVVPDLTLLVPFASPHGFNWVGYGLPGDSGSEVMNDAGLAVGDLTHGLSVAGLVPVPGLSFGTDMAGIFEFLGSGYKLVTADGRKASCAKPLGL